MLGNPFYGQDMNVQRLETSRLFHRFAFGPRPGEYAQAIADGISSTRTKMLTVPASDAGATKVVVPTITNLGPRPAPNSKEIVPFAIEMRYQVQQMTMWWLDRMALSDHGLTERMTWFWHGHWATSVQKLNFAMPMFIQNNTFRTYCLGNFKAMSRAMINDGALQFWLDGQDSTLKAPNENLGRELMELFVLGVDRYSEDDVKAAARALTGYQVVRSSGEVSFNAKRHDPNPIAILGTTQSFTGEALSDFLVARDDNATFIAERLWYRFISSTESMPTTFSAKFAFANREISAAVNAMANDVAMRDETYAMVKSPVEWFISACRALELTPSALKTPAQLINYLDKLGQVPFNPPNVGGWPAAEAWLSSATAQYRIAFAGWLIKQSDLRVLNDLKPAARLTKSTDWLGVPEWSARTQAALRDSVNDPAQFALLALCSPEYVVSA
ncbi:Protein of unknown function DUF1800 [Candidatus Nanopelagicaceae bacterium]